MSLFKTSVLLSAVMLLTLAGCAGDETPPASCPNCGGCCQSGICQPGNTPSACGINGAYCVSCPSGQTCSNGACVASTCGPGTCNGCCYNGQCLTFDQQATQKLCGLSGSQCQACSGQCVSGQCQSGACNATNCQGGCCTAQGVCIHFANQNPSQCGSNGTLCQSCGTAQCNTAIGQCSNQSCSLSNCAQGCCTAQGACVLYSQQNPSLCGSGAQLCQSCGVGTCNITNGTCSGSSCNSTFCPQGCCTSSDQCILYGSQNASMCGTAGQLCRSCGTAQCQNGMCQSCNTITCPQGCCTAQGQCLQQDQQSTAACGLNANACQPCANTFNACLKGLCSVAWKVRVLSAVVTDKDGHWDDPRSLSGLEPDPYVIVKVNATGEQGKTLWIDDTFTPSYGPNEQYEVLQTTEQALTDSRGITCTVKDDDGWGGLFDDDMGSCSATLNASILAGGNYTLTTCTNHVTQVQLQFAK